MSAPAVHHALEATTRPDKTFATLAARAALRGVTVHRTEDDRGREVFLVTRWHLTRELPSIQALEAWIDRLEGRA